MALKSFPEALLPRCRVVMRYRWKRSVPAEREMAFEIDRFSWAVEVARRSRVSEMVERVGGSEERRRTRDSMAATGMVRSGSERRREM